MQGKARCCEIKVDKNCRLNAFVMNVYALAQARLSFSHFL